MRCYELDEAMRAMIKHWYYVAFAICAGSMLAAVAFLLGTSWDEGWNFCVARNLVERQHFGCSILGQLTTARLANSWLPILMSAVGFQLFGFELWAGRILLAASTLLGVFCITTFAAFISKPAALGVAMVCIFFVSADPRVNPLILGAQVWGEMPMIFAITLGLGLLGGGLTGRGLRALCGLLASAICFGLALQTKPQLQPFLLLALVAPSALLAMRGEYRRASIILTVLSFAWICFLYLPPPLPSQPVAFDAGYVSVGSARIVGFVLDLRTRLTNFEFALTQGWYLFLALGYLGCRFVREGFCFRCGSNPALEPVVLALYVLVASWFGWFLFFAIDFARYLAPPLILGVPLVALALGEVTKGFEWRASVRDWVAFLRGPPALLKKGALALVLAITALHVVVTTGNLLRFGVSMYNDRSNEDLKEIVTYINDRTPPASVIETYESMAFYMLKRAYHFPPDQVAFDAIEKKYSSGNGARVYDPLDANPDYILQGPWGRSVFKIYDELEKSGKLSEEKQVGAFTLYKVR